MPEDAPMIPRIIPTGVTGFLVRFGDVVSEAANERALAFHDALQRDLPEGVVETAPSLISVFVRLDPVETDPGAIETRLAARIDAFETAQHAAKTPGRLWTIPCAFNGPQLSEAAQAAGLSEREACEQLLRAQTRVLTLGFAPGQPYLGTLDEAWDIPRMTQLNMEVPRGALVVAVRQLVLFTNASPTGWRHIANTAFRTFKAERAQAIALRPGDHVQFASASPSEIAALHDAPDGLGGATCVMMS